MNVTGLTTYQILEKDRCLLLADDIRVVFSSMEQHLFVSAADACMVLGRL